MTHSGLYRNRGHLLAVCYSIAIFLLNLESVGQAEENGIFQKIIQSVEMAEQVLTDLSIEYNYRYIRDDPGPPLPDGKFLVKISRHGLTYMEYIDMFLPGRDPGKAEIYIMKAIYAFDGDRAYDVFEQGTQYIIKDPKDFLERTSNDFIKRGTVLRHGSRAKLSTLLKREDTRIVKEDSFNGIYTIEVTNPDELSDGFLPYDRYVFDIKSGVKLVAVLSSIDFGKYVTSLDLRMSDFFEIVPGTWFAKHYVLTQQQYRCEADLIKWDALTPLAKEDFIPVIPEGYVVIDKVEGVRYTKNIDDTIIGHDIIDNISLNRSHDVVVSEEQGQTVSTSATSSAVGQTSDTIMRNGSLPLLANAQDLSNTSNFWLITKIVAIIVALGACISGYIRKRRNRK